MLNLDDTIAAVSTPAVPVGTAGRSIIRISGPTTYKALSKILSAPRPFSKNHIQQCVLKTDDELNFNVWVYAFFQPHSYTGQDLVELHLDTCGPVTETVLQQLYRHVRPAAPGEFTQRAYLNGKMDLTQAEAVAEIIAAANSTQLAAAEQLLRGRFSETISTLRQEMIDLLGLLEAGLDFSEEDIEFITPKEAITRIRSFEKALSDLLNGSIRCERIIDLDSVGLAGVPNAGKSSLLNALLGQDRSIVSEIEATTRDVLTGVLKLEQMDCVLFDCAGLLDEQKQDTLINTLSYETSISALNRAALVLFCVDAEKSDIEADVKMLRQITAGTILYVLTKTDKLNPDRLQQRHCEAKVKFGHDFLLTSAATGRGLSELKGRIRDELLRLRSGGREYQDRLTINQRHERKLTEAINLLTETAGQIQFSTVEIAAMLLRQAYEQLGGLETEDISETILDSIFSQFCIGK